ncbi:MAG: hypothetical protein ACLQRM_03230 [Acidimicrobiales bacterium]
MMRSSLRALGAVVLAGTIAACTNSTAPGIVRSMPVALNTAPPTKLPVVDLSATPAGWVPVAYGDAQVSVPPSFPVVYPGLTSFCKRASASGPGGLLVDIPPGETVHCVVERHPTMVYFTSVLHPSHIEKKSILLNGVRVHRILTAVTYVGYYAPSLGVQVIAQGPLAKRILATLTSSPRAVALAPGSAPAVQLDWKTLTFHGLAFAAPSSWPVMRTPDNLGIGYACGTPGVALSEPGVVLSTDKQSTSYFCPALIGPPAPQTPQDGIQVDAGSDMLSQWNLHIVFSNHCLSLHGLTACPATSPAYSILVLKVTVHGALEARLRVHRACRERDGGQDDPVQAANGRGVHL